VRAFLDRLAAIVADLVLREGAALDSNRDSTGEEEE
jgi:hypothetical protein